MSDDKPPSFPGFDVPESNWFKMPNEWINISTEIRSMAEMKVVEYLLRHTWGFHEYGIKIHLTVDEFMHGRWKDATTRWDNGTGLAEQSVRNGLKEALEHGLIIEHQPDDRDKARIKKYYSIHMRESGVQDLDPRPPDLGDQDLGGRGTESRPRTLRKKDTFKRQTDTVKRDGPKDATYFLGGVTMPPLEWNDQPPPNPVPDD